MARVFAVMLNDSGLYEYRGTRCLVFDNLSSCRSIIEITGGAPYVEPARLGRGAQSRCRVCQGIGSIGKNRDKQMQFIVRVSA